MPQNARPLTPLSFDRPVQRATPPVYNPIPGPDEANAITGELARSRLAERVAREEAVTQGALNDRHRQIETLTGQALPRSMMMTGQDGRDGVGALADAAYEQRVEALRLQFPDQMAGVETRADLAARLSGHRSITYYDTPRGKAEASTRPDGSLWLQTPDGYSGPLSRFPGARPVRAAAPADTSHSDGSVASARQRSLGERFTSTFEDAASRNPIMALGRLAAGGGYDEFEDPEHPGQTIRYASFGQDVRDYERERRDSYDIMAQGDRWDGGDASAIHKLARGVSTLGGMVGGSAADPTSLIAPGEGALGRIAGSVAVNAATDAVTQGADVASGVQDQYSPEQTIIAGAVGGIIQGGIEVAPAAVRAVTGGQSRQTDPGGVVGAMAQEIDRGSQEAVRAPLAPVERAALARVDRDQMDLARFGTLDGPNQEATVHALDNFKAPPNPVVERELDDLFGGREARQAAVDAEAPTAPAPPPPVQGYADARIQRMRDALQSGRMLNGLDVDAETRAHFESEIAAHDAEAAADVLGGADEPTAAQPAGPAAGSLADVGGTPDAGRVAQDAAGQPADAAGANDHLDQNHADLGRLAQSEDPALAAELSARMSHFMDWTDVPLSRRDRAAVRAGEPVSPKAMIEAARRYEEAGAGSSFYDPDAYSQAMMASRAAGRDAGGPTVPARFEAVEYQGRRIYSGTFDPMQVGTDAERLQYKAAGDEGLTDRLSGVTAWDRTAAGRSILFEGADGRVVVADGHQRRGLARRLIESGQDTSARLDGFLFREADGWTVSDVRVIAALKNIREASGTILDAAKVFREAPALINDRSLPITGELISNARGLARLSDDAFRAVAAGAIPDRYGSVIGELSADRPDLHASMVDLLHNGEPRNLDEARALVQEAKLADFAETMGLQDDLFGGAPAQSTLIARARLRASVLKQLRTETRLFGSLIRNADAIEAAGNALARTENEARLARDAVAMSVIDRLSLRVGQVGDTFGAMAAAITRGDVSMAAGTREIVDELRASAKLADAADSERKVNLTPDAPSALAVDALKPFDQPGGRGQVDQAKPKPEDAEAEARAGASWDDLPEATEEQKALDVLRVCAPGK